MSAADWRLLGEAWLALARARRRLAQQPLTATIAGLRHVSRRRSVGVDSKPVVQAVLRAKHLFPAPMLCLPESLAITEMLVRRGQPCALVLGARLEGEGLDAHAWVEQDGVPINSPLTSAADHPVYLREQFDCEAGS